MSRLREAYINAGQFSPGGDPAKMQRWTVTRLWFESTDPRLTKTNLQACGTNGGGVKMNGASAQVALDMSSLLTNLGYGPNTSPASCGAMFDPEPFHPADVLVLLQAWRRVRTSRYTLLTIPPWQGGLITPELAQQINGDANLLVALQLYMTYAGDDLYPAAMQAVDDLVLHGIDRAKIVVFLPVKTYAGVGVEIPYGWAGLLWTFDALPSSPPAPL